METQLTEKVQSKGSELKVTLVFSQPAARLIRAQAKESYLPITTFLKCIVLRALDQHTP